MSKLVSFKVKNSSNLNNESVYYYRKLVSFKAKNPLSPSYESKYFYNDDSKVCYISTYSNLTIVTHYPSLELALKYETAYGSIVFDKVYENDQYSLDHAIKSEVDKQTLQAEADFIVSKKCNCEMIILMRTGCVCGGK